MNYWSLMQADITSKILCNPVYYCPNYKVNRNWIFIRL